MSEVNNYPSNSYKSKEEAEREKRVEKPVVSGTVKVKKKSELSGMIISEDASNVKNYVIKEVLVPAFKNMVSEGVKACVDMFLYGGQGSRNERRSNSSYVSYNRYSDRNDSNRRRDDYRPTNSRNIGDFIFNNRGEAEEVLSQMDDILRTYGLVRVGDLYDLIDESCPYTYENYGWTSLRNAEVVRVRDGYMLKLPKALPVD